MKQRRKEIMCAAHCVFIENETKQPSGRFANDLLTTLKQCSRVVCWHVDDEKYARYHRYEKRVSNQTKPNVTAAFLIFLFDFLRFVRIWFAFCLCVCFFIRSTEIFAIEMLSCNDWTSQANHLTYFNAVLSNCFYHKYIKMQKSHLTLWLAIK